MTATLAPQRPLVRRSDVQARAAESRAAESRAAEGREQLSRLVERGGRNSAAQYRPRAQFVAGPQVRCAAGPVVDAVEPAARQGRSAGPVIRINSGARYTAVVPARLTAPLPTTQIYVRRRLLVALVFVAVVVALWAGAGTVLANRGGDPASIPTVSPAATYVVRSGDTLWSIAQQFHGHTSQADYVDTLVAVNGGTHVQVGQVITLP